MFGAVPKVLWEKALPADEKNRIPLCSRVLIIEGEGRKVLVDTGCGDKWDDKRRENYAIKSLFPGQLSSHLTGITDVVLTHLHFDHAGGVSCMLDSKLTLSFPEAKHYVSRENFERASNPGPREKGSYLSENVSILSESDLTLMEDQYEVLPGIRMHTLYGHTKGMQILAIEENAIMKLAFLADLVPTHHHLPLAFVMGYDMCAETTIEERKRFYQRFEKEQTILVFEHDRDCAAGMLESVNGKYSLSSRISLDREL